MNSGHGRWVPWRLRLLVAIVAVGLIGALAATAAEATHVIRSTNLHTEVNGDWSDLAGAHLHVNAFFNVGTNSEGGSFEGGSFEGGFASVHLGDAGGDCEGSGPLTGPDDVGSLTGDFDATAAHLMIDVLLEGACAAAGTTLHLDLVWMSTGLVSRGHFNNHGPNFSDRGKNFRYSATVAGGLPAGLDAGADLQNAILHFGTSTTMFRQHSPHSP